MHKTQEISVNKGLNVGKDNNIITRCFEKAFVPNSN